MRTMLGGGASSARVGSDDEGTCWRAGVYDGRPVCLVFVGGGGPCPNSAISDMYWHANTRIKIYTENTYNLSMAECHGDVALSKKIKIRQ